MPLKSIPESYAVRSHQDMEWRSSFLCFETVSSRRRKNPFWMGGERNKERKRQRRMTFFSSLPNPNILVIDNNLIGTFSMFGGSKKKKPSLLEKEKWGYYEMTFESPLSGFAQAVDVFDKSLKQMHLFLLLILTFSFHFLAPDLAGCSIYSLYEEEASLVNFANTDLILHFSAYRKLRKPSIKVTFFHHQVIHAKSQREKEKKSARRASILKAFSLSNILGYVHICWLSDGLELTSEVSGLCEESSAFFFHSAGTAIPKVQLTNHLSVLVPGKARTWILRICHVHW